MIISFSRLAIISFPVAVLLENFSIFYNDDDTNLSLSVIKDFKRKWRYFDTQANVMHDDTNMNVFILIIFF